jgi:hypothetical protein
MERKYPTKMFLFFIFTNFVFHYFYLFVPGLILCIVGIWTKACLWIGLAVLGLDLILSVIEQLNIRNAALTPSDNPEFNELMDAFCSPDGPEALKKVMDEKIKSTSPVEPEEDES